MSPSATRRAWHWLGGGVALFTVASVTLGCLLWTGAIHANNPSVSRYPVRGVDVSGYQGSIDWPVLAGQDIRFAFIKATEGSTFVDDHFAANLAGANAAGLRVGAYHFFSFESPGATQADNVIRTVPAQDLGLPVVVDLESYGEFGLNPAPTDEVRRELGVLLDRLRANYGRRPVVYATAESYDRYLAGAFADVDIWIRDTWREPALPDGRPWTFWQFSDRHRLAGYAGEEPFIDLDVFAGSQAEWEAYGR